jgi:DNA replication protein DnaC
MSTPRVLRGLDRAMVRQLATCAWVGEHLNVLITGATGVGKIYLASALGQAACRKRFAVMYRRVPRLLDEIALARVDGTYAKLLARLTKASVLVLDDLGLGTPTEAQRHDLLEVMEDRYGHVSTVVTSQLPVNKWHEWIGDPTVADAILDRLVHNAYKLDLRGSSKRKEKPNPENEKK